MHMDYVTDANIFATYTMLVHTQCVSETRNNNCSALCTNFHQAQDRALYIVSASQKITYSLHKYVIYAYKNNISLYYHLTISLTAIFAQILKNIVKTLTRNFQFYESLNLHKLAKTQKCY